MTEMKPTVVWKWQTYRLSDGTLEHGSAPHKEAACAAARASKVRLGFKSVAASVTSPWGTTWTYRPQDRTSGMRWARSPER
jgi:hypothetical protein